MSIKTIAHVFTHGVHEMELEADNKRLIRIPERSDEQQADFAPPKKSKDEKNKKLAILGIAAEKFRCMDDHRINLEELFCRLGVNKDGGLSNEEAIERNKRYGDNTLSEKKKTPWYLMLLKELTGFLPILLWIAGVLSIVVYLLDRTELLNLYLGIVLLVVNLLTGIITYTQNAKSEAIVEASKNFIPPRTKVLRNGSFMNINAAKLVPGDIIELKAGDRVPADIRILFAQEMRVDNSSLTGESDPLLRTVECTNENDPLETNNLVFFGTLVKEGFGSGIVIHIGDYTVIGQIPNLSSTTGIIQSPLREEIDRFIRIIFIITVSGCVFFFILGFMLGYNLITNLIFTVGIIFANVPEGLIATVIAGLTITARRLSQQKILVKNLEAVETLGSISCICVDKTGTLTQNKMTVAHIWYGGKIVRGQNYQKFGQAYKYEYDTKSPGFKALQENALLCSEAVFDNTLPLDRLNNLKGSQVEITKQREKIQDDYNKELCSKMWLDRPVIGDASEAALIKFFQPIEDIQISRSRYPIKGMRDGSLAKIPFNSSWKYALTICDYKKEDSVNCIFIKGAPEKIWQLSSYILIGDEVQPIDDKWKKEFQRANCVFGQGGERVLGFAKMHLPKGEFPKDYQFSCKNVTENNFPMKGFIFTGLFSLINPPRDAVPFSVLKCKTTGIKVIMVTGDQPETAAAIARHVNIFGQNEVTVNQIAEREGISLDAAFDRSGAIVIHGDMITQATQEEKFLPENKRGKTLAKWLKKPRIVFARTTPAQKILIVKGCQQQGHIVAVTGDGASDAPALKKADIGIAMGITGSDIAKDAADLVLLTDDFATIVAGIEEGRKFIDNLKKSIMYALTANIPELLPFLLSIIFRFPLPISTVLVLCISIGTDLIPAIALASEEAELGIMTRPPRRKTEYLITKKLITAAYLINGVFETFAGFLTYFVIMRDFGFTPAELFGLATKIGFVPNKTDVYNPDAPFFGQTSDVFIDYCKACWEDNSKCDVDKLDNGDIVAPDWLYNKHQTVDLRLFYLRCGPGNTYYSDLPFKECTIRQLSSVTGTPVCYTPEALKYAQTGFFLSIVIGQISNAFSCKSREHSFIYTGIRNYFLIFGFAMEITLTLILAYAKPFNIAFNTRAVYFLHYGIPAVSFAAFSLLYEEIRKFMARNARLYDLTKPNWFYRNTYW